MINKILNDSLSKFTIISAVIHALIVLFIAFGFFSLKKNIPQEEIITVEILPVGQINNVKKKTVQKKKKVENKDAKKVVKTKKSQPKPKQAPKVEETKPVEKPVKKPSPKAEPLPSPKKEKIKLNEAMKAPKQEEKKEVIKKEEDLKKEVDDVKTTSEKPKDDTLEFDSILKNLEEESQGEKEKSRKLARAKSEDISDVFSANEKDTQETMTSDEIIKQQIKKHWSQPIASADKNIQIDVELFLDDDGTVVTTNIKDVKCPSGLSSVCIAARDSILRAIALASPLVNLDTSDYITWSQIIITFNTSK